MSGTKNKAKKEENLSLYNDLDLVDIKDEKEVGKKYTKKVKMVKKLYEKAK